MLFWTEPIILKPNICSTMPVFWLINHGFLRRFIKMKGNCQSLIITMGQPIAVCSQKVRDRTSVARLRVYWACCQVFWEPFKLQKYSKLFLGQAMYSQESLSSLT